MKVDYNKAKSFKLQLSAEEYMALKRLAAATGVSLASQVRLLVRGEARRAGLWAEEARA